MLIFLCFTKTDMQEWDNLKIEELNRKQHAHLGKKAVLILHQWLLGCRSCLNTLPAPGPLTCSSQWQRPRDTGWSHPRDCKPQLMELTSLIWVGEFQLQERRKQKHTEKWRICTKWWGQNQGRGPQWSRTPKYQQNENIRWETLWKLSTQVYYNKIVHPKVTTDRRQTPA